MPKTLTLRHVPDEVVRSLKERARRNRRSLQRELLAIVGGAATDRRSLALQLREQRAKLARPMKLEQIQRAIAEGRA